MKWEVRVWDAYQECWIDFCAKKFSTKAWATCYAALLVAENLPGTAWEFRAFPV